jgi:hypothetical protein
MSVRSLYDVPHPFCASAKNFRRGGSALSADATTQLL